MAPIELCVPKIGEYCAAIGYCAMDWTSSPGKIYADNKLGITMGQIRDVHIPRRDSHCLPFPCFRTDARFEGGMSGGPVIGQSGKVVGVVCAGTKKIDEEDEDLSYASLIAPAMLMKFPNKDEAGDGEFLFGRIDWGVGGSKIDQETTIIERSGRGIRLGLLNQTDRNTYIYES